MRTIETTGSIAGITRNRRGRPGASLLRAAVLGLALAGCAGATSDSPGDAEPTVSGVASTGGPMSGTVSLTDSSAQPVTRTAAVATDGSFSLDVRGLTPPYALRVEWSDSTSGPTLSGVASTGSSLPGSVSVRDASSPARTRETSMDADGAFRLDVSGLERPLLVSARFGHQGRRKAVNGPALYVTRCAGCHGPLASSGVLGADAAAITAAVRANAGGTMGSLADLTRAQIDAVARALAVPAPAPACTYAYSEWGACQDGTRSRTVTATPAGCAGTPPPSSEACSVTPPACTYAVSDWGACANGTRSRTVTATPAGCAGTPPPSSEACSVTPPACTYAVSGWSACVNGTRSRTVTASPAGCAGSPPPSSEACTPPAPGARWTPAPGTSWQWQLTGALDTTVDVAMYDIDLFDTSAQQIASLRSAGRVVICYFSAGSYEDWRPDAASFPAAVKGRSNGWAGESWLDVRSQAVRDIMAARMDLAVSKGCDGVEPDNVDGYGNSTGFPLTAADQLAYNRWLASAAHARGLSVGLKNDVEQAAALVGDFDWALNEECFRYDECGALAAFIEAGKAVFQVEYGAQSLAQTVCPRANALGFDTLIKRLDVTAWRVPCR